MILFLNAQSIIGKIDELCFVASVKSPDLILVTESWCNQKVTNAFLSIPGYEVQPDLRRDRSDTVRGIGGGLLVYVRTGLTILPIDKCLDMDQYCSFRVLDGSSDVTISLIYRSPNPSQEVMDRLIQAVKETRG